MRNLAKLIPVGLVFASLACSDPPKVVQGKVLTYETGKVLVVEDEVAPHAKLSLDLTSAEVGGKVAAGGLARVAYHDREGRLVAGRVMSVSSQKK